jgi:hypothetical protein
MRHVMLAIVVLLVLGTDARADLTKEQAAAYLNNAQVAGANYYRAVLANNKSAYNWFLSFPEARAYFATMRDSDNYNAYYNNTVLEAREIINASARYRSQHVGVALIGMKATAWRVVQPTRGGNVLRATMFVTMRPLFNVGGKQVWGEDVVNMMLVGNIWKVSSVTD